MTVDSRRIVQNTLMLYLRMLLLLVVSLYTSRVILATLGVENYGIYNLIGGFVTFFSFISTALVGALQRFFNVALGHGDHEGYRRIYSMGMNIFVLFCLCILILGETIGLWFVKTKLNIPNGRETAALWVYQISLLTVVVTMFRTPDNASIIAHEKMEFYAFISILEAVLKLVIVYFLNLLDYDKLVLYVVLYILTALIVNAIYAIYCRMTIRDCRYNFIWDGGLFRSLVAFSGWNTLTGLARVVKSQGDSYFINHFFTVTANAAFGIASQAYNAVNLFLVNFQTAFNPQLVQSYAANDMAMHYKLLFRSAKLSYYLLFMIVLPVSFNLEGLLGLWLKEVPQYTRHFCLFVLCAYLVDSLGAPLAVSVNANGRIRGMQVCSALLLLLGGLTSFLSLNAGAPPYAISIVTFAVHCGFWMVYLYYARRICGVSLRAYARKVIIPATVVSLMALTVPFLLTFVTVSRWTMPVICLGEVIWVGVVIYWIGMESEEKRFVFEILKRIKYRACCKS